MSEGKRSDRLARVLAVQERKRQQAEWALAELVREQKGLEDTRDELLDTLGAQSLMQGLFLDAKVSALRRNDLALAAVSAKQLDARERVRAENMTEKRVERAAEAALVEDRIAQDAVELLSALEDHLVARAASLE
ncbi:MULTISPECIES: hypothetical protein [Aureimonas]|uniref:Flagellar FliJ protein n=1 Tax=Aureimonas ureilytica TaxID=401562 RepID=A0A175R610_9HYPH|nr:MULTISPECIES: hypothetical protein [Aureimonas]KTQ94121.1 hypothetical protein NS226_14880 [Aureimonas ureilytica]